MTSSPEQKGNGPIETRGDLGNKINSWHENCNWGQSVTWEDDADLRFEPYKSPISNT